ncbi:hypothetical protein CRYUN_Cryun09bG0094200 [Craigia yunnanensis]
MRVISRREREGRRRRRMELKRKGCGEGGRESQDKDIARKIYIKVHCMKFPSGRFNGNAAVTFKGWIEDFSFSIQQHLRGFALERMARAKN